MIFSNPPLCRSMIPLFSPTAHKAVKSYYCSWSELEKLFWGFFCESACLDNRKLLPRLVCVYVYIFESSRFTFICMYVCMCVCVCVFITGVKKGILFLLWIIFNLNHIALSSHSILVVVFVWSAAAWIWCFLSKFRTTYM